MKIIFDINKGQLTKTFIDDNKAEYSEVWEKKTEGYYSAKCKGQSIAVQLDRAGYESEFIEAVDELDAYDIWNTDYVQEY